MAPSPLLLAALLFCFTPLVASGVRHPPIISTDFTTSIAISVSKDHHGGGGLLRGSATNTGHLPSTALSGPPHSDTPFTFFTISSQKRNATYIKMVDPPSGAAIVTLYGAEYSMECYVDSRRRCLSYCPLGSACVCARARAVLFILSLHCVLYPSPQGPFLNPLPLHPTPFPHPNPVRLPI